MAAGHSPMDQFAIKTLVPFEIGGYDLAFTNSSLWMLLAIISAQGRQDAPGLDFHSDL